MPRTCTVCAHAEREAIDAALVAGDAFRHIASRFGTSTGALQRHKAEHLPASLALAQEAADVAHGDDLLAQVRALQARTLAILATAEGCGALAVALRAISEARGNLELLAKLLGELQQEGTVSVVMNPEWAQLRGIIVAAVAPYPEARRALLEAIGASD